MDKKNFDLALVKKINLLIQKNVNNDSPFEWFVVGFLYAHPHNIQSLDKIFVDVHTVISLNRTNHFLTPEDTNEILIKMINNLISSQINGNLNKKPEITLSSDSEKPTKAQLGKSSPNKSKAKPLVVNAVDSPNILLNSAEVNNKKLTTLGVSKPTKIPEDDDISYDSGEQFNPKKTRSTNNNSNSVQNSEDLFKDNNNKSKKASVSSKKSPIKSSESLIASLKPKEAAGKKSTTKEPPISESYFEDDISFESDNDLKPSKSTKVLTRNAAAAAEEKKPSTSKAKLVTTDKSPVKTPNKGGFKFTNNPPEPTKYLEDDRSYESENNLIEIDTKKEPTPNNKSGKVSLIKEEQEVNYKLTASSFAQLVQGKKSATKDPPKVEKKKSGDTEDLILSEPEETKSLIAMKAGKKSVDKKKTEKDLIEKEFNNGSKGFGTSAELITAMQKRTSNPFTKQQSNMKKEKDEDSWGSGFETTKKKEGSNHETLSQKKQKAVQLAANQIMNDLIISLEDDTPIEQETSMNSRFKKQRVHQPDEFEMTLEVDPKVKEAPSMNRKPKHAQLIDDSECIQLVETPPDSPKQIYFTKKSMNKGSTTKDDIELIEEPVTFTRKPIDKVQVDQPKSAKELRDARRFMSPEEEEKLSKAYIEKMQLEDRRGASGNKRKKQ